VPRRFNIAGSCKPALHYMLPPLRRLPGLRNLVARQAYFVLHAPRQSGKTTAVRTFAAQLVAEGKCNAAVLSIEVGTAMPGDVGAAELAILADWREKADRLPAELRPPPWPDVAAGARIGAALAAWARRSPRPLVLFLDEIDAIRDMPLVSVLRQLRSGFDERPEGFPSTVALVGMRDVRDYVMQAGGSGRIGSASPFNIKDESLTLRNFTRDEVSELYAQHTGETGQAFEPAAVDRAFELSGGHPWLVNALARQLVEVLVPDRAQTVTLARVDEAKELLIQRRDTHLDSLAARLEEPRVRRIVEPMIAGDTTGTDVMNDDYVYVRDLGLVGPVGETMGIANPIYREIIPRVLTFVLQQQIAQNPAWYVRADGSLDMPKLMTAFQQFWRTDGHLVAEGFLYREAGPHLLLQAFLQRVVNGGGRIEREYALGRRAMDLLVVWRDGRHAVEVKIRRDRATLGEGLRQLSIYLDTCGLREGWLLLLDKRKLPWSKRIFHRVRKVGPRKIHVLGL